MTPTIVLFDLDGTLVSCGGAGRRAIARAFGALHDRPDACDAFSFDGMTDQTIARQGLTAIGVTAHDERIGALLARYLEALREELGQLPEARYVVHAGAREAVAAATARGFAVGLGTGNVREGARLKLQRADLVEAFAFGGFGDDAEARPELVLRGAQRGAAHLGVPLARARVLVVGDTTRDVHAAQAIGAACLAVATGGTPLEALRAAGATWAFSSLAAPGALEALLG